MTSKEVLMKERTILDQSDVFKINHNEVHVNSTFPYILDQSLDGFMDDLMKRSTGEFTGKYSRISDLKFTEEVLSKLTLSYTNHYDQKIIDNFLGKVILLKENKKTIDEMLALLTEIVQYGDFMESRFIERILDIKSLNPSEFNLWDALFINGILYTIITDKVFDTEYHSRKRKRLIVSSLHSFRDGSKLAKGIEDYQLSILPIKDKNGDLVHRGGIKYFADVELLRKIIHELEDAEKLEVLEFSFNEQTGTLRVLDLLSGNSHREMDLKSFEISSSYFAILLNLFKGKTLPWCKSLEKLEKLEKELKKEEDLKGLMLQWQTLRQIQKNINLNPQIFDLLFSRENDEIRLKKTKLTLKDLSGLNLNKVKITCSHKDHKGVSLSYDVKKRSFT